MRSRPRLRLGRRRSCLCPGSRIRATDGRNLCPRLRAQVFCQTQSAPHACGCHIAEAHGEVGRNICRRRSELAQGGLCQGLTHTGKLRADLGGLGAGIDSAACRIPRGPRPGVDEIHFQFCNGIVIRIRREISGLVLQEIVAGLLSDMIGKARNRARTCRLDRDRSNQVFLVFIAGVFPPVAYGEVPGFQQVANSPDKVWPIGVVAVVQLRSRGVDAELGSSALKRFAALILNGSPTHQRSLSRPLWSLAYNAALRAGGHFVIGRLRNGPRRRLDRLD